MCRLDPEQKRNPSQFIASALALSVLVLSITAAANDTLIGRKKLIDFGYKSIVCSITSAAPTNVSLLIFQYGPFILIKKSKRLG